MRKGKLEEEGTYHTSSSGKGVILMPFLRENEACIFLSNKTYKK